jgi:hypothetical protein
VLCNSFWILSANLDLAVKLSHCNFVRRMIITFIVVNVAVGTFIIWL